MDAILAQLPEEGYLFPRWRKPQTVSHKLKRILRSIGRGDMWLHGLRHNTATKLSRKGYPVKARMKLLGHVQMSTMLRYDHPDDNDLIDAGNSLHFDPILKEPSDTEEHKKSTKHKKAK
jgi:integrase